MYKVSRWGLLCLVLVTIFACSSTNPKIATDLQEKTLYTKYNIHTQYQVKRNGSHVYAASYANYTSPGAGHTVIPPGTKVELRSASPREIKFFVPEKGYDVDFEYHQARMGMDVAQYIELIFSDSPLSYSNLSKVDRKGIEEGKALAGMSREGVLAALGYPAAHRTPSLESLRWVYWTNRFGTVAVDFDESGKVKKVTN